METTYDFATKWLFIKEKLRRGAGRPNDEFDLSRIQWKLPEHYGAEWKECYDPKS